MPAITSYHRKLLSLTISLSILFNFIAVAQQADDNIVIENKKQSFLFRQNKGDDPVLIREDYTTEFKNLKSRATIVYTEIYNDKESVDNVEVSLRNKPFRGLNVQHEYYSIKDIFYSDARVCHFEIPFTDLQMPAKVTLSKTHKDPRYFTKVFLTEEYFVQNKEIEFIIPRWMKCELKEYNFAGNDIKKTSSYDSKLDADIYTYTMKDLPAFKHESNSQGIAFNYPHILVMCKEANTSAGLQTYFKTIDEQYKWCYNIVKDIKDDDAALKAKAEQITQGLGDNTQKVKAVLNWVHQNIRYIAYEDGIAAFKPAKATEVMNKKYGDCKGMANLIKGLLSNIGLDARLCWIGTNHIPYDLSTPSLSVHNHMIAAWLHKGQTHFLDGTETNIAFDQYAERIAGRQVLIENGEKYILTKVPDVVAEQNPDREKRVLTIEGQDLKGKAEHIYKGEARSDMINKLVGTKKDNTEKALINYLSEDNQDYNISNLKRSDIPGTDSVLQISYDLVHKNGASVFGNEIYLDLDIRKEFDGFDIDTSKRIHNLQLSNKIFLDQETELTIPQGYKISTLPANLSLENSMLAVSLTYKQVGNKLVYHKQMKLKQVLLKKSEFGTWNDQIKQLTDKYKEQVVLSK